MNEKIENAFTYHPPKEGQPEKYEALRKKAKQLAYVVDGVCPDSREKSLAMTKLEEVVMWANASIARGKQNREVSIPTAKELREVRKDGFVNLIRQHVYSSILAAAPAGLGVLACYLPENEECKELVKELSDKGYRLGRINSDMVTVDWQNAEEAKDQE